MNRYTTLTIVIALILVGLLISATSVGAQHSAVPPQSPSTTMGTAFTYQGQLKSNGNAVTGSCDFQFGLWDAANAGTQVGLTQTLSAINVVNGLFTASLDFGANAFTGDARWLQIAVRCPGGSGTYTTLSPRQALTAVPYALSLTPNATVNGLNNTGNLSFGSTTRQMLNLWGTQYGIGIQGYTQYYRVDSGAGFAWYQGGHHTDAIGDPGPGGKTLMSLNSSGSLSVTNGIRGFSNGGGNGVAGTPVGVYGESVVCCLGEFMYGIGVKGEGGEVGVEGHGDYGVYGAGDLGVYGIGSAFDGVKGENTTTFDSGYAGVFGRGSANVGVRGQSSTNNGVLGQSSSSTASGVYGENFAGGYGIAGRASPTGTAVLGDNPSTSGYAGYFNGRVHVQGNLEFTGNLIGSNKGGYVSDIALNDGNETLSAGDVVAVIGYASPVVGTIPVARVAKASSAYQTGVIGIVDQHVTRGDSLRFDDGPIAPGEYGNIVTLGMYRIVKVDASYGAIHAGDLLVASPHAGYAMKASDRTRAIGAILGKALGDLESGIGVLPLIVTLQ